MQSCSSNESDIDCLYKGGTVNLLDLFIHVFTAHGVEKFMKYEKMPGFGTHIFWLGIPKGSQKWNSMCVLARNLDFHISCTENPLKNDGNLTEKWPFLANGWYSFSIWNLLIFSSYSDTFRHINDPFFRFSKYPWP